MGKLIFAKLNIYQTAACSLAFSTLPIHFKWHFYWLQMPLEFHFLSLEKNKCLLMLICVENTFDKKLKLAEEETQIQIENGLFFI